MNVVGLSGDDELVLPILAKNDVIDLLLFAEDDTWRRSEKLCRNIRNTAIRTPENTKCTPIM